MPLTMALAGRRVDPPDADVPRFPLANVPLVRQRLRKSFAEQGAKALVCSAACGADLVALETAASLGMRRRIVLPFDQKKFRETSVTDRPGDWGPLYDRVIEIARRAGELVVLEGAGEGAVAYAAANESILDEALRLSGVSPGLGSNAGRSVSPETALALIVWEGRSRGADDATRQFADLARQRGLEVKEVRTV